MELYGIKKLLETVNPIVDYDKYGTPIKAVDDYTIMNEMDCLANTICTVNDRLNCSTASLECRVHELEAAHNVKANDFYPRIDNITIQLRDTSNTAREAAIQVRNLANQYKLLSESVKKIEEQLRSLTVATTENPNQKTDLEKINRIDPNPFLDRKDDKLWY